MDRTMEDYIIGQRYSVIRRYKGSNLPSSSMLVLKLKLQAASCQYNMLKATAKSWKYLPIWEVCPFRRRISHHHLGSG